MSEPVAWQAEGLRDDQWYPLYYWKNTGGTSMMQARAMFKRLFDGDPSIESTERLEEYEDYRLTEVFAPEKRRRPAAQAPQQAPERPRSADNPSPEAPTPERPAKRQKKRKRSSPGTSSLQELLP